MIGQLTSHLWQSTLFAIAAGLLALAFRNNRAQVRFSLWLCASLKFFVPFALLTSLGSQIRLTPAAHEVASQYATPAMSFAVEYVTEPFTMTATTPPASTGVDWILVAFLSIWACGFLTITTIRLRLWLRVRAAVRASTAMDIPAPVEIRSAPGLLEPGVVGLWKPVLLLPEGIVERLTPPELEAVLAHELCHVRRRDNLFAVIHMVVEAVFWFHPFVWWIGARMVEERERACDEDVLNLGNQPRVYAGAILSVCKLYTESPLVCVSGVTGSNIRRRIEAIMMNHRGQTLNRGKKALLAMAGSLALAGPVVTGVLVGFGQLPEIHAQSSVLTPPVLPLALPAIMQSPVAAPRSAQPPAVPPPSSPAPALPDANVILFDLGGTTADVQARARAHAVKFVQELDPTDIASVIVSAGGEARVAQDFTRDRRILESTIQNVTFPRAISSAQETLAGLVQAASSLEKIPGRKSLVYYWTGAFQVGSLPPALLRDAISSVTRANVSLMPVVIQTASAAPSGGQEMLQRQYNTFLLMRMFLSAPSSYNLREIPVVYPAALATFTSGVPSLPGGASSVKIYPGAPGNPVAADARFASISTPMNGLPGTVTISSEIRRRTGNGGQGAIIATLVDQAKGPDMHRSNLGIDPGTYVVVTTVRDVGTTRSFTDTVNFEVK